MKKFLLAALLFAAPAQAQVIDRCVAPEDGYQLCQMASPGRVLGAPAFKRFRLMDIRKNRVSEWIYLVKGRYGPTLIANRRAGYQFETGVTDVVVIHRVD